MQTQISLQAGTIKELIREINRLEREGVQQAERIAELEALLFAAGVLDKDGQMNATDADKRWYASQVLERYEGTSSVSFADTFPVRGEGMRDVEDAVPYGEEVQA